MPKFFLRKLYQTVHNIGLRDLLYLLGGSSSSQLFNAISVSLIYAYHSNADAATYFLYLSFISVFVNVASFRLEQAALVDHKNSSYLLIYAFLISFITVLIFNLILMFLTGISINQMIETLFLSMFWSAFLILSIGAILSNKLKLLSVSRLLQSLIFLVLISCSIAFEEGDYLLSMMAISYLSSIVVLTHGLKFVIKVPKKNHFFKMLEKHKAYIYYDLPSGLISSLAIYIPLWIVAANYSEAIIALFGFAIRVIYAPLNLLGGVIKDKYKADTVGLDSDMFLSLHENYKSLLYRLSVVMLIPAIIIIYAFTEEIILFACLTLISIFRFNVSPVSFSIYFKQKIEWDLRLHIVLLSMLSCLAVISNFLEFNVFMLCYAVVMIVFYAVYDRFIVYIIKRF